MTVFESLDCFCFVLKVMFKVTIGHGKFIKIHEHSHVFFGVQINKATAVTFRSVMALLEMIPI